MTWNKERRLYEANEEFELHKANRTISGLEAKWKLPENTLRNFRSNQRRDSKKRGCIQN